MVPHCESDFAQGGTPLSLVAVAAVCLERAKERHIFDNLPKVTPVSFAPFDAKNGRTEAVVGQNGQRLRVMKGAVRTIAEACELKPPAIEALEKQPDRRRRIPGSSANGSAFAFRCKTCRRLLRHSAA